MNISAVRNGLAGAVVALTAISCECKNEENIARSRVVPYLNGTELYTADSVAQSDRLQSLVAGSQKQKMLYWDSIVAEGKAKEAFMRGMQMVNDSAEGKPYKKEKFELPLAAVPSTDGREILDSLKKEASKMNDAKTYNELLRKEPAEKSVPLEYSYYVHYYGKLLQTAREREAYNRGADIAHQELGKTK